MVKKLVFLIIMFLIIVKELIFIMCIIFLGGLYVLFWYLKLRNCSSVDCRVEGLLYVF